MDTRLNHLEVVLNYDWKIGEITYVIVK
jgi:hypothetical protein